MLIFNKEVFFTKSTFSAQQNLIVFSITILKTAKFDIAARFAQSVSAFRKKPIKNLSPKGGILTAFHYGVAPHGSVAMALSRCDSFVWLWLSRCFGEPAGFGLSAQLWASPGPVSKPTLSFTHLILNCIHYTMVIMQWLMIPACHFSSLSSHQQLNPFSLEPLQCRGFVIVAGQVCWQVTAWPVSLSPSLYSGKYIVSYTSVASSSTSVQ